MPFRSLLTDRGSPNQEDLKFTLKKILVLLYNPFQKEKGDKESLCFDIESSLTFQVVTKCLRHHTHIPVEVFQELVQDVNIPNTKLLKLAKYLSLRNRKYYHLFTRMYIKIRLFPEFGENDTNSSLSWTSTTFELETYKLLLSTLLYIHQSVQETSGCFLNERQEIVMHFLRLIPFFRRTRCNHGFQNTTPCEEEEIWANIILNFKRLGSITNKCKDIDEDIKEKIRDIEFRLISVSVIRVV